MCMNSEATNTLPFRLINRMSSRGLLPGKMDMTWVSDSILLVDTTWTYGAECWAQNLPYVADLGSLPTHRGLTPGSHMAAQLDSDQLSCRSGQLASGNETIMLKEAGVEALSHSGQPSLLLSTRVEFFESAHQISTGLLIWAKQQDKAMRVQT